MNAISPFFSVNALARRLDLIFPGFFSGAKHNHYKDFGYPEAISFEMLFAMYTRNSIARAAVDKTIAKCWQDTPFLLEKQRDGSQGSNTKETTLESELRQKFEDIRLWQNMAEADRRSMVGSYSGVILRIADDQRFSSPVKRSFGQAGLASLVEVIPAWEGQLTVSQWVTDERDPNYGQPRMFQFNESAVDKARNQPRSFNIHPDRVVIWSRDGTVHGRSALEPGYNDLIDLEKIKGAGGEGFWKNAKAAPVLQMDKEAKIESMAKAMGVPISEIADKMDEQVGDWQKGFDQMLFLQGIEAKAISVNLPSPEHFWAAPLQAFAASMQIPLKILVGMQTGERASTEDADEWSQTNMSRRKSQVIPNILTFVNRLERFGMIPERDWFIDWSDLTEASMSEKVDRANKMADINTKSKDSGEFTFTPEEIRATMGYEPLSPSEARFDPSDEDLDATIVDDPEEQEAA